MPVIDTIVQYPRGEGVERIRVDKIDIPGDQRGCANSGFRARYNI
jgi:hypothetical protein